MERVASGEHFDSPRRNAEAPQCEHAPCKSAEGRRAPDPTKHLESGEIAKNPAAFYPKSTIFPHRKKSAIMRTIAYR